MRFEDLKLEYDDLFKRCVVRPDKVDDAKRMVERILSKEEKYRIVQAKTSVPWSVIAVIHSLESSLDFSKHLHNGDPLTGKTTRVPKGRPPGNPPFTWEDSAADALQLAALTIWRDWSVPGVLFSLERFNGFGYRGRAVPTPYLWSFSHHYSKGKFVRDGVFDTEAISEQCGAAVVLKIMLEQGVDLHLNLPTVEVNEGQRVDVRGVAEARTETVRLEYPGRIIKLGEDDEQIVRPLQLRLNELGCGPLRGTGFFGRQTETAVKLFQARFPDTQGRALIIDGEVGSITWAALFGADTVPSPLSTTSMLLTKVLEIAASQIGVVEKPRGSNSGPEVDDYLHSVRLGPGFAWCVAFQYWCFKKAAQELGVTNPMIQTAGVLDHWNQAGRHNIPRISTQQAMDNPSLLTPGMIFTIDTGAPGGEGHAGFVEKVTDGRLTTIEGNTNDGGSREGIGVFRRDTRKIASINKGFIDYSSF